MKPEHVDVLIVGAGLSGLGAACHLKRSCPGRSFVILEGRDATGGTWDLFRYPGIRSDSDMHTLGYSFRPWRDDKAIADGPAILTYIRDTAREHEIDPHIRLGHPVERASWSSETCRWTVEAKRTSDDESVSLTCSFLLICAGYYRYEGGHRPRFKGEERFGGRIVHPQAWPEDLETAGQRVVVIGSGATAMTLVPALAQTSAHVTMLQRSPTYVLSMPSHDTLANALRRLLPERVAYRLTRWKNTMVQQRFYKISRAKPDWVKRWLLRLTQRKLGPDFDVATHFTPRYNPWDQRLCLVPDDDLFIALRTGAASVVTDHIEHFTETGLRLASGKHLDADLVVTATGLEPVTLGQMVFEVDRVPVDFSKAWTYKGMGYSDVPNMASVFGYVNASWTLRADLICELVCRLLNHMETTGTRQCTPRLRPSDHDMPTQPWVSDFTPGYLLRVADRFPRQSDREPWVNPQDYARDKKMFRGNFLADGALQFTR